MNISQHSICPLSVTFYGSGVTQQKIFNFAPSASLGYSRLSYRLFLLAPDAVIGSSSNTNLIVQEGGTGNVYRCFNKQAYRQFSYTPLILY